MCEFLITEPLQWTKRVRKEMRDMPLVEREAFKSALWTIRTLTQQEGEALYGPDFKTYNYFIFTHAAAAESPMGDQ
eukprot:Pgem_evm1s1519